MIICQHDVMSSIIRRTATPLKYILVVADNLLFIYRSLKRHKFATNKMTWHIVASRAARSIYFPQSSEERADAMCHPHPRIVLSGVQKRCQSNYKCTKKKTVRSRAVVLAGGKAVSGASRASNAREQTYKTNKDARMQSQLVALRVAKT